MQPIPRSHARSSRLVVAGAVVVVLLLAVAVSSHAGFGHGRSASPSHTFVDWAFSAFLVLFVLAIPFVGYAYVLQAREVDLRTRRRFHVRVGMSLLFVLVLFTLLLLRLYYWHHAGGLFRFHVPSAGGGGLHGRQARPSQAYTPHFEWPVLVLFGLLLAGGTAVALKRRGGTPLEVAAAPAPADELAATIGDAIGDLEREPDARRAVIAAYARMEGVLARQGLARRASETPLEYLRRALLELTRSRGAVERLTGLFELAKFSDRPVDAAMKGDAIDALREIRDGLVA